MCVLVEDLNSSYYRDDESGLHLVPWPLRVLAVRLQGMGYADARRGVMGFYELAREARLTLTSLKKSLSASPSEELETEIALWESRLAELGIRVSSALIEMEDLEGAARFLSTLKDDGGVLGVQKALLFLCLGDVDAARVCISGGEEGQEGKVILALANMADGEYEKGVEIWEDLLSSDAEGGEKAMWKQNLAVCFLYLGRMDSVSSLLPFTSFHALRCQLSYIFY
jgi:trafficking protein particle complex subunit 12